MFLLANYYFNPHALPVFFVGILTSFIGLFVFLQKFKSPINRSFFFLCISVSVWLIATAMGYCSLDGHLASNWFKIDNFGVLFISVSVYAFSRSFLNLNPGLFTYLGYIQAVIFGFILLNTEWLVTGAKKFYWGYFPQWGLFSVPVFLVFFGYMLASYYLLVRYFFKGELLPAKRNQVKYLIVGYFIGYTGAVDFLPTLNILIYPFGYFSYLVFLSIIAYAVVKYSLLDIRIALVRTFLFLVVYGAIFVIPIMVAYIYKDPLYAFMGTRWGLSLFLVGSYSMLASLSPLFYSYLQRKTEGLLLKDQRRYQEALIDLSADLTLIKKLDRLLKFIVLKVTKAVKIEFACIYIDGRNTDKLIQKFPYTTVGFFPHFPTEIPYNSDLVSYFRQYKRPIFTEELSEQIKNEFNLRSGIIIPSFVRNRLLGFLVMGPKSSGAIYTPEDAMVFRILSAQVGLAIENTQFLKEFEETQAKLREAEKLKGIAQMMHSLNHEFRNLFNNMLGAISFLLSIDDKEAIPKTLAGIEDNVTKGVEILEAVGSYNAKSKSDEIKLRKIPMVLNDSLTRFQEKFQKTNIKYTLDIPPNLPDIQTRDTFEDLFPNIFQNCWFCFIELPEDHEKLIDIKIALINDKKTLQIKISDTGRDITKSAYQSDKDTLFKERGRLGGVNLYLAYLIANDHKGTLKLESYEKGGITFIIEIPITQKENIS